jgi:hypothetical protein
MSGWEKKKILITAKAYPEKSKKYGPCVCTMGVTEEGEWIRIYPIPFELFRGQNSIKKFDWIEVECQNYSKKEILHRKESHKIRPSTLKVIDSSLNKGPPVDWEGRNEIVMPKVESSIERLRKAFKEDRTSLGMIKPKELFDFYMSEELNSDEKTLAKAKECYQETLYGEKRSDLEILKHVFRYKFSCHGDSCNNHDITCEDWELFQSYRKWRWIYKDKKELWEKIRQRYFDYMVTERDLYFFMGTYFLQPSWLIVGLYYPPKNI